MTPRKRKFPAASRQAHAHGPLHRQATIPTAVVLLAALAWLGPWAPYADAGTDTPAGRLELRLSGDDWTLAPFEPGDGVRQRAFADGYPASSAFAATVPGDVHWDLERAGRLPPIYVGTNSQAIGWVAGKEWWYRKTFNVPDSWQGKRARLRFAAVDYLAEVWLNGHYLGRHEGQFTPFEFEVTRHLEFRTENRLVVLIHSAPAAVRDAIARGAGEWEVMHALRPAYPYWKSPTNAGWDWGAKIITMGIWQDVTLIASDDVYLSELTVLPRLAPPYDLARLEVRARADTPAPRTVDLVSAVRCLTVARPPVVSTQRVDLATGSQAVALDLAVNHPQLWWPNGYGPQHRYELELEARAVSGGPAYDRARTAFGIRDLQMLQNPEAPDNLEYIDYTTDQAVRHVLPQPPPPRKYLMQINGRRIFGRGGNWIPCDLLYGRPREPFYEHLIRLAARANFNLFRMWGGGLIEPPAFYDLCDRYGIMLFQEFPNAGVRWPETDAALAISARETREILPGLMNHPCIVRYGGGNEWYRNGENSRQMAQLRRLCNEIDPTRPYHDPDPECIAQRHGPHGYDLATHYQTYNTGHPLTGGPDNPLEWTEYGAAGAASVVTLRRIIPAEHLWPIRATDPYWVWHKAFNAFGADNWLGSAQYLQLFGDLPDLETTVRVSQFVQAEGLRYANQAMRRRQWHRSACASWTYNEPWPNAAHGCVVEYYGQPKMAYYYCRDAFAPVAVSAEYDTLVCRAGTPFPLRLFVTSDRPAALSACRLAVAVVDLEGRIHAKLDRPLDVPPEATTPVETLPLTLPAELAGQVVLCQLGLQDKDGRELSRQTYTFAVTSGPAVDPLAELRVPALAPDLRRNLALLPGVKASASSVIQGYPIHQVAHLNNGWYGNDSSWIAGSSPAWVQLDLGTAHRVSRVCVGNDRTHRFKDRGARALRLLGTLQAPEAASAAAWQELARYAGEPLVGTRTFDFPPIEARCLRIEISEGEGVRLDEIEVYEAEPVPEDAKAAAVAAAVRGAAPPSPTGPTVPRGALRPLLAAPSTLLELTLKPGEGRPSTPPDVQSCHAEVRNAGRVPALFIELGVEPAEPTRAYLSDSHFTLLPGESRAIEVWRPGSASRDGAHRATLRAKAWNSVEVLQPLPITAAAAEAPRVGSTH